MSRKGWTEVFWPPFCPYKAGVGPSPYPLLPLPRLPWLSSQWLSPPVALHTCKEVLFYFIFLSCSGDFRRSSFSRFLNSKHAEARERIVLTVRLHKPTRKPWLLHGRLYWHWVNVWSPSALSLPACSSVIMWLGYSTYSSAPATMQ